MSCPFDMAEPDPVGFLRRVKGGSKENMALVAAAMPRTAWLAGKHWTPEVTRFLHANRYPLRSKTLWQPFRPRRVSHPQLIRGK
jgi:hypothetical protein